MSRRSTEAAFYGGQKVRSYAENAFVTNLQSAIDNYLSNNSDVKKVVPENINKEHHFAVVTVYRDDGSGNIITEKRFVEGASDDTITSHYPFNG